MGEQVTATLDDDLYDKVCDEHTDTGKSKSQVVNERVRAGYNGTAPTLSDTVMPVFGQSLFIAGFIAAFFATAIPGVFVGEGVGVSLIGLAIMLGVKVDNYKEKHNVGTVTAFVRVLGA